MTNAEALSLLSKIAVEQKSMKELWTQLTPATQQVAALVEHVNELQGVIGPLEAEVIDLRKMLGGIGAEYQERAKLLREEEAQLRAALSEETAKLRTEATAAVNRLSQLQTDLKNMEQVAKDRLAELDKQIGLSEARLKKINDDYAAFRAKVGA